MKKILLLFVLFTLGVQARAQYKLSITPTNAVLGEKIFASYAAPLFSFTLTDWLGFYSIDADDGNAINRDFALFYNGTRSFDTIATGLFNIRYFDELDRVAISPTIRVYPIIEDPLKVVNFPGKGNAIAILSDSLGTDYRVNPGEGWVSILERETDLPIENWSVSGTTTAQGLARLPDVLRTKPQIVVVLLGGNNAIKQLPEHETFADLRKILGDVRAAGAVPILIGVPGGIDLAVDPFIDRYADNFNRLWQDTKVTYVPNILNGIVSFPFLLTTIDLVHPNATGHRRIAEKMATVLGELYVPPPRLTISKTRRGSVVLEWNAVPETMYTVSAAPTVTGPWTPIAAVTGATNHLSFEAPLGTNGFFRVNR